MYQAVEWYFPEYGQNFDPRGYIDICAGRYVDDSSPPPDRSVGQWSGMTLVITGRSLGRVRVGMTIAQAQDASGFHFDTDGDGYAYPTTLGFGYPHLYVGLLEGPDVTCVGVAGPSSSQSVVTSAGFRMGQSVTHLRAVYGHRLRYLPPPKGVLTATPGYVVTDGAGVIAFILNGPKTVVTGMTAGPGVDPSSCDGVALG
jgi:hypothetical protein